MTDRGALLIILGLAGSGKSHLVQALKHDFLIEENFAINDQEEHKNIEELTRQLNSKKFCVISERKYLSRIERDSFLEKIKGKVYTRPSIHFICFENDIESANHNCKYRDNKSHDPGGDNHISQNNSDTKDYEIPDNAIVIRIHRIAPMNALPPINTPESIALSCVQRKDA